MGLNYLMKGLSSFLGHSLIARLVYLLWQSNQIDSISAIVCGVIFSSLSFCYFLLWHYNASMNHNIINFIAWLSLFGAVLGLAIQF